MTKRKSRLIGLLVVVVALLVANAGQSLAQKNTAGAAESRSDKKAAANVLKLVAEHSGPVIGAAHPDVVGTANKAGFETGQVVKLDGVYHMFVNEMFNRPHRDLRISYWTSTDAVNWKRQSTIRESIPSRTPTNPRSEVWLTGVVFNNDENAWNIFYVAYRGGDSTKGEIAGNDYEGRIWRAKSVVHGRIGIAGPYADMGIVLQPDSSSQPWEGDQAVASLSPYKAGNTWYAIYDGHNHVPRSGWPDGMAFAPKLSGPWTRMPEGINPLTIVDAFAENHIVSRLKDGRYFMVFDSLGDHEIGYSTSADGVHWAKETRVKVQSHGKLWAEAGDHSTRTPLCAIEEEDGTFTVVYTARTKADNRTFYAIGQCTLSWQ